MPRYPVSLSGYTVQTLSAETVIGAATMSAAEYSYEATLVVIIIAHFHQKVGQSTDLCMSENLSR